MKNNALPALLTVTILAACSPGPDHASTDGTWVGTITTEGTVTTVVNESGSVWGGTARLVEEASIGVETGADEYMLGWAKTVYGTNAHIYIIDGSLNLVRRYDENGVFLGQIGRIGQGPGEYTEPGPLAVAPDGRIFVWDPRPRRVLVFAPDGTPLETRPAQGAFCCMFPIFFDPETAGGALWMLTYSFNRETAEEIFHIQAFGPEGSFGTAYELTELGEASEGSRVVNGQRITVPFSPTFRGTTAGPEGFIAANVEAYRFKVKHRGEIVRVVEKSWEPVPIDREHREWQRRATIARVRQRNPGWTWDGSGMPEYHPAYDRFHVADSGEVWVLRNAPSLRVADCIKDPLSDADDWGSAPYDRRTCWTNSYVVDVFDAEGRFLGDVEAPGGAFAYAGSWSHIDGDRVVMAVEDEAGTVMVKRYRLVLPGEAR